MRKLIDANILIILHRVLASLTLLIISLKEVYGLSNTVFDIIVYVTMFYALITSLIVFIIALANPDKFDVIYPLTLTFLSALGVKGYTMGKVIPPLLVSFIMYMVGYRGAGEIETDRNQ